MPYRIVLSEAAGGQLGKLDRSSAKRIVKMLRQISENPMRSLKHLSGRDELKLRVGDYRLIIEMLHREGKLLVIAVGHRRDIYIKH